MAGAWGAGGASSAGRAPAPAAYAAAAPLSTAVPLSTPPAAPSSRDLARREADLARREAELRRLEAELRAAPGARQVKNWPRFCSCVHHDIAGEVPAAMQGTVRAGYFAYLGLVLCLLFNFIAVAALLISDGSKIGSFLWGALYLVGGVPGAWYLWYGRLYHAAIKDSAFGYGTFFLFFCTAHMVFVGWSAIGPPILNAESHAGFWIALSKEMGANTGVGIVYLIGASLWALEFLWSFWTLKGVYGAFRGKGLTAADVKRDAARGAASAAV
jgi:hypothetical protein